jgi:hypothetical protein
MTVVVTAAMLLMLLRRHGAGKRFRSSAVSSYQHLDRIYHDGHRVKKRSPAPSNTPPLVPTTYIIRARRVSVVYVTRSDLGQIGRCRSDANVWVPPPPPCHLFRRPPAMVSRRLAPSPSATRRFARRYYAAELEVTEQVNGP